MKNIYGFLVFVIVLLCSCGMETKTVAQNGGVQLKISGVGAATAEVFNNRITSVFSSAVTKLNNEVLEIEIPELVSSTMIKNMVGGQGKVLLKPSIGNELILDKENINEVKLITSSEIGQPQIAIAMNQAATKKWAEMTKQNIGRTIEISVDGNFISAPTVNTQISGGRTSIVGKNELETKLLFSLIKFPSDNPSNVTLTSHFIFVKDEKGTVQQIPNELIKKYEKNRREVTQNGTSILGFIQKIQSLKPNAKSMLSNDVKRIIESDVETYLLETKVSLSQFGDIMGNVEKLISSYNQGI